MGAISRRGAALLISSVLGVAGCSSESTSSPPAPPGSCHTGGTATGSSAPACNQCGQQQCNAELSDKAGSGWASQYFGGDGACAAFNDCVCACPASASDPLTCATTTCISKLDAACQAAVKAAQDCLDTKCADECKG